MTDIKATLTKQIGPLPVYAWGALVGGGILIARKLTGGGVAGVGGGGTPLGTIVDADPGTGGGGGSGGSDGGTQPPAGTGSTGTVGGNGTTRILTVNAETPLYAASGSLSKIIAKIFGTSKSKAFRVQLVTVNGHKFWKIISRDNGTSTIHAGQLIRYGGKTYTVKTTQAA